MVAVAVFEVIGVASIMPFIALIQDPGLLEKKKIFEWLVRLAGTRDIITLQMFAGVITLLVLIASNITAVFSNLMLTRFVHLHGHRISCALFCNYLRQPYVFFLSRNSAELGKNILSEVQRTTYSIVLPALQLISKLIVVVMMVLLLLWVDPVLALVSSSVIGALYASIFLVIRKKLSWYGVQTTQAGEQRFRVVAEAFGGIKETKLGNTQTLWEDTFSAASLVLARYTAIGEALKTCPKYILEIIAFGGIILIALYLLRSSTNPADVLSVLALYAFAGYRLMPAMQQIYSSIISIRYNRHMLELLTHELGLLSEAPDRGEPAVAFEFTRLLEARHITYAYPASENILHDISLTLRANTTIGFAGASGAGKTTLTDILLGLLTPSEGTLAVDGVEIGPRNRAAWQAQLGYVPQHIFLADDSLAANIAFGVEPGAIDMRQVELAARQAHIHDFIATLPEGYATTVGERGVRLSGGQRQRVGIARALYRNPRVLVLDEATSALDNLTENAVMEAIRELSGKKTIIIIAHRMSTLAACDIVHLMDKGRIIASGAYHELLESSPEFKALTRIDKEKGYI